MFDTHIHVQHLAKGDPFTTPCLVPAVSDADWQPMIQLSQNVPRLWLAMGVHPQYAERWQESSEVVLAQHMRNPRVVAVGEIGLDKRLNVPLVVQEKVLRCQLRVAVASGKPVILHVVRCVDRLVKLIEEERVHSVGGIVHGFYGSGESARQFERLNLSIGIGRLILDHSAKKLPEVVQALDPRSLVIETDAPWQGAQENWQCVWMAILDRVAALRGWSREQAIQITDENARRVLRRPKEKN